jgi:hypothetical protein
MFGKQAMKRVRPLALTALVLMLVALACGGNETPTSSAERGWLCDWDGRGEVNLWAKPALASQGDNSIVAVVGMSVKGCVDAILLDETTTDNVLFYKVSVGGDQGWVDVDYFYPVSIGKPDWSQ